MPAVTKSLGEGTQSVLLTVAILESLARDGSMGVSELARTIGTSKSRIFRHLQTLQACDFLARSEVNGHYEIGTRLAELSRAIDQRHDILSIAGPVMAQLRSRWGHTVVISRVAVTGVQVLGSLSGGSPIVLDILPGTVLPFDTSAQGKVAMAFTPEEAWQQDGALATACRAFAARARSELEAIRQQRWAVAQMRQGLKGIAAPVLDGSGKLVATLALLDTASDMGETLDPAKVRDLQEAAAHIGRALG